MTLLTIKTVAGRLNVHPTTIHRMINRGELAAYRVGGAIRIESRTVWGAVVNTCL